MIEFCNVTKRIPPLMWLLREMLDYTDPVLETTVMGVDFANRSACPPASTRTATCRCSWTTSLRLRDGRLHDLPRSAGNPKPWFHRLPEYDSMMVHVGLANDGSDKVILRSARRRERSPVRRIRLRMAG